MDSKNGSKALLPAKTDGTAAVVRQLPPILAGRATPDVQRQVERFYLSVAEMFERWVTRRSSEHTQRAYRQDVMSFVAFLNLKWPEDATALLTDTVRDVQEWRDELSGNGAAPKTLNRRVSSVSSFYKFLQGVTAELRLPITVPNPAHAQFIARDATDPVEETKALSAQRARQLMGLPAGDTVIEYRDRAILKFYLYSGARIATGCRLKASDFHQDGVEATIRLSEKGSRRRTIGLHFTAAEAIREYIGHAEITRGPLFRPRLNPRSKKLAERAMDEVTMWRIIMGYLEQLPGAMKDHVLPNGGAVTRCIFTPHSLRATTATLLLDATVDIRKVQDLLGHRHITTTQIYDKRRIGTKESASHDVPI